MRCQIRTAVIFTLILSILWPTAIFAAEPGREYKIKAGFLYKFLHFAQWPKDAFTKSKTIINIGIIGENPFGTLFSIIKGQTVKERKLVVLEFKEDEPVESLKQCHILFISPSITDKARILESLKGVPVLTVSESKGFASSGGMINFLMQEDNVSLEINKTAAENVGIKLRSRLLRVARIIEE
ncbi:MAG: YfiR family protein [bacterium]|nr:YfiR family protein [bacterium]